MADPERSRTEPMKASEVTDKCLKALAPDGFKPSDKQIAFVRQRLTAKEKASVASVAAEAGIAAPTVYRWYQRYPLFHIWEARCLMYLCKRAVPRVWAVILDQAERGCKVSQKRILDRYDMGMRNEKAREKERQGDDDVDAAFARASAGEGSAISTTGPRCVQPRGSSPPTSPRAETKGAGGESDPPITYRDRPPAPDNKIKPNTREA